MTEREWLTSVDPLKMVTTLCWQWGRFDGHCNPAVTDRKLLLFVEALNCTQCRRIMEGYAGRLDAMAVYAAGASCGTPHVKADFLRDIFGNPWRPVGVLQLPHESIGHPWLEWQGGLIPRMARRMYDANNFADMPILGDMLEEAGCTNEDVLMHCRGMRRCAPHPAAELEDYQGEWVAVGPFHVPKGPIPCRLCKGAGWVEESATHARGCWVVDLILGER